MNDRPGDGRNTMREVAPALADYTLLTRATASLVGASAARRATA